MSDCDCPTVCQCSIRSSVGTAVTGTGSTDAPFAISLDIYDPVPADSACDDARDCLAAHVGPGVAYDSGTQKFRIKISENAGNTIVPRPNGLYSAGGVTACRKRVSDLSAAAGGIVFGDQGAGTNHFPQGLRRSVRAAADLELDGVFLTIDGLADGTPYLRFCGSVDVSGRRLLDDWCIRTGYYTNISVADLEWQEMTTQALRNIIVGVDRWYEGDFHYWPSGPNPPSAPRGVQVPGEQGQVTTGPFGNHYVGITQIGANTVAQVLNDVGRDLVIVYYLSEETITQPAVAPALRDTILKACAQQSSIVVSRYIPDTVVASQAGIQTGYYARGAEDLAAPVTPAVLVDAGIDWLFVDWRTADAAILPYKTAGLRIIQTGGIARRDHAAKVLAQGYNGVVSVDASYYLNRTTPFPLSNDLWPFGNFMSGQLHPLVEDDSLTAQWRGAPRNHQSAGVGYPPLCGTAPNPATKPTLLKNYMGWNPDVSFESTATVAGQPWDLVTTILGWACPLPKPTSYSISWSHIWNTLPITLEDPAQENGLGMLISLATDADVRRGATPNDYYWLHQTASGRLVITRWKAGVLLRKASIAGTAVAANVWQHFKVTVSPTAVVFERYDVPSTKRNIGTPTLQQTLSMSGVGEGEPGPRGTYVGIHKHQDGAGDRFSGGWGNFEYASI